MSCVVHCCSLSASAGYGAQVRNHALEGSNRYRHDQHVPANRFASAVPATTLTDGPPASLQRSPRNQQTHPQLITTGIAGRHTACTSHFNRPPSGSSRPVPQPARARLPLGQPHRHDLHPHGTGVDGARRIRRRGGRHRRPNAACRPGCPLCPPQEQVDPARSKTRQTVKPLKAHDSENRPCLGYADALTKMFLAMGMAGNNPSE